MVIGLTKFGSRSTFVEHTIKRDLSFHFCVSLFFNLYGNKVVYIRLKSKFDIIKSTNKFLIYNYRDRIKRVDLMLKGSLLFFYNSGDPVHRKARVMSQDA